MLELHRSLRFAAARRHAGRALAGAASLLALVAGPALRAAPPAESAATNGAQVKLALKRATLGIDIVATPVPR